MVEGTASASSSTATGKRGAGTQRRPSRWVAVELTRVVGLRWAGAAGLSPRQLLVALIAAPVVLSVVGVWAASGLRPEELGAPADLFIYVVCLVGFSMSAGVGILASHFSEALYRDLAWLRLRPVGRLATTWVTRIPAIALAAAAAVAAGPGAVVILERLTGHGWAHAVAATLLLLLLGGAAGWLLHWLGGCVLRGHAVRTLRLSITFTVFLMLLIGGMIVFSRGLGEDAGYGSVWRAGYLLWPLALWFMLSAGIGALVTTTAVTAVLLGLVARAMPSGDAVAGGSGIRRPFWPEGMAVHARLTARRLWRHPRTLEWLLMGVLGAGLTTALGWYGLFRLPVRVDLAVVVGLSVSLSLSFSCLVRGLSDRTRPLEGRLHRSPRQHVGDAVLASLGIGVVVLAPLAIVVGVAGEPGLIGTMAVSALLSTGLGLGVSFVLAPRLGEGGAEMLAFVVYLVAGMLAAAAVDALGGLAGPALAVAIAVACLGAAVVRETVRRSGTQLEESS